MLCDSSNLHKQKLVKPKPLASKMAAVKKWDKKMTKSDFWLSIYSVVAWSVSESSFGETYYARLEILKCRSLHGH